MGNCLSAASPAGAVHAAEALPAAKLALKGTAVPAAAAARKRGAVGQADASAAAEDTVENLPSHAKSEAEVALIVAAVKDNILFRVRGPLGGRFRRAARARRARPRAADARAARVLRFPRGAAAQDLQEPELQSLLVGAMAPLSVPAGTAVITQGERNGDTFYVVQSGGCDVTVDGKHVGHCGPGRAFGELALLYSCPRAATLTASEPTRLWALHQRWFRLVARSAAQLRLQQKARPRARAPWRLAPRSAPWCPFARPAALTPPRARAPRAGRAAAQGGPLRAPQRAAAGQGGRVAGGGGVCAGRANHHQRRSGRLLLPAAHRERPRVRRRP